MNPNTRSSRMFPRLFGLLGLLGSLALAGCSGGDNTIVAPPPGNGGGNGEPPPVALADVSLIASSNLLESAGTGSVTLTAIVRDVNNNVVEGVTVVFSADSGLLQVLNGQTDSAGAARAQLTTAGDPTNRPIDVTASVGSLSDSLTVNVVGTTLTISEDQVVTLGDTAAFSARLANSTDSGLSGRTVNVTSSTGNVLSASSLLTDAQGVAQFQVTASQGGVDTLTVTALGMTDTADLEVLAEASLVFLVPDANQEVELGEIQPVTVEWTIGGIPQPGTVNFSTTRGNLSAMSAVLDPQGRATVNVSANTAGPATLAASVDGNGAQGQRSIEFVAITPAKINVQASRFTVGPGEQSTIVATVRDANDNPVKNKVVLFQLEDVSGGGLSVGSAVTGSAGTAQTVYTAGQTVSASNGVKITATVQEDPSISGEIGLTVARRQVDISIGTGNELAEPNTATYEREFVVQVTDSQGVGIEGATVQLSVRSKFYKKGVYEEGPNNRWVATDGQGGPPLRCPDEDFNFNGQLDANEDFNDSGQIEAGNIVSVSPGELLTGENGTALFKIAYAQEFGNWAVVTISARASVQGTEFQDSTDHALQITVADASTNQSPPGGLVSRFGGFDVDTTIDPTDPQAGSARLTELGYPNGRPLGCRTLN